MEAPSIPPNFLLSSNDNIQHKRCKAISQSPTPTPPQSAHRSEGRILHITSVIQVMKQQESTVQYRPCRYLDNSTGTTARDRRDLCQWGFDVVDACGNDRRIATIAITYFDRFMSCQRSRAVGVCLADKREFQLAFVVRFLRLHFWSVCALLF